MSRDVHGVPAYGRDYRSSKALLADWQAGKDFRDALTGQYFSVRDADKIPGQIWIRYANGRNVFRVKA